MLDINLFRTDLAGVAAGLAKRGVVVDTARFAALESERKRVQSRTQELQAKRNAVSKQIGAAKARGEDAAALLAEAEGLGAELTRLELELARVQEHLREFLLDLPNLTHPSTPEGTSADDNVEVRRWGPPARFRFPVKEPPDLGGALGSPDFPAGAKFSGCAF